MFPFKKKAAMICTVNTYEHHHLPHGKRTTHPHRLTWLFSVIKGTLDNVIFRIKYVFPHGYSLFFQWRTWIFIVFSCLVPWNTVYSMKHVIFQAIFCWRPRFTEALEAAASRASCELKELSAGHATEAREPWVWRRGYPYDTCFFLV